MQKKMMIQLCVVALAVGLVGPVQAGTTINFDDDEAPDSFGETNSLTEAYAGLGVHFAGPGDLDGGAILDQSGNFGVWALSARNFLAFNRNSRMSDGGVPQDPETILFDSLMSEVSIYAAGGWEVDTFIMDAYDASGTLVDTDTITTADWGLLSVSSAAGIRRVVLTQVSDVDNAFVYDDLSFTVLSGGPAVPAPGAILLGTLGTGLVGWLRRRRAL
ncbi:MAG: hypothetical protein KBE65_13485 [Phycisphaerae bacterium]|nr:hypothetical protein [Phycisphaerae bacterium]